MVKILFYDSTIDTSCQLLSTETLTRDYFDIEAHKILKYIGIAYIRCPIVTTLANVKEPYNFSVDLNKTPTLQTTKPDKSPDRPCVIFKAYK